MPKIIYSPNYDMGLLGLERLHPFDTHKYSRAWQLLKSECGDRITDLLISVDREVTYDELRTVHSSGYLESLASSKMIAQVFEVAEAAWVPAKLLDYGFLRPMRWAVRGTLLAAQAAIEQGLAIHLGGGFHHAKPQQGEGFCVYSDVALAIAQLRQSGELAPDQRVLYIDLDAHMGNGVCHQFLEDRRVLIYDQYNSQIYPKSDHVARARIDCNVPLAIGCGDDEYLSVLRSRLTDFLNTVLPQNVGLAIYNAGTDPVHDDPLGFLNLSEEALVERDEWVVATLRERRFPTMTLTSGGYTESSHRLIARSCRSWIAQES